MPDGTLPAAPSLARSGAQAAAIAAHSCEQQQASERATVRWLGANPGKDVGTQPLDDLPGAVFAILAISNVLSDNPTRTSYKSKFDSAPVTVPAVSTNFWKPRPIASSNPFRLGATTDEEA